MDSQAWGCGDVTKEDIAVSEQNLKECFRDIQ